ncbi:unnamed protein product [Eruca vesicaria subsp. sativa]|uniref:Uncharacterized protein n=1 Tax=Eruca vesicaria subsp. sativa TaxID=29727 RepID=A0ABC8LT95_ERUVS|nr:unnamed protein product [Eruca vesicaria subsp. sativa]
MSLVEAQCWVQFLLGTLNCLGRRRMLLKHFRRRIGLRVMEMGKKLAEKIRIKWPYIVVSKMNSESHN